MLDKPTDAMIEAGVPPCQKCNGTKQWQYDHNHVTICDACCEHAEGWWLLMTHYGESNGKYACKTGCGATRLPSDLGIAQPQFVLATLTPDPVQSDGETEMCDACCGSGFGVADTYCGKCDGSGGIPAHLTSLSAPVEED